MDVQILHRSHFVQLNHADVESIAANVWAVTIRAPLPKRLKRPFTEEAWDGALLLLDGEQSQPAVVSALTEKSVTLTVVIL